MSYKKILVAIDRPPVTPEVFEQALELAKKDGAKLMVLHCARGDVGYATSLVTDSVAGTSLYSGTAGFSSLGVGDLQMIQFQQEQLQQEIEQDQEWLQTYCQKAVDQGVATETDQEVGNPGSHICDLARDWGADLIVIGRRGLTGLQEIFLGSVSNHVIHHAPCSVLVVQGEPVSHSSSS